jgi:hypothetical protein
MEAFMKAFGVCVAIGVAFLGCSSSSGSDASATCGKVAACGGSIVGTWKIVDACADTSVSSTMNTACPNESAKAGTVSASGTVTFNADMTYKVDFTESVTETLVVPMSCLSMGGATVSCDELTTALGGGGLQGDAGTTTATCTTSGANCNCTIDVNGQTTSEMGTYTVSGTNFTTTSSTSPGSPGTASYCVQGSTLHVISTAMGMGTMGMPTSDLVATKQ